MQSESYRPDVDGLRGVAILAVLLFHYGASGVTGGFVGVDIFFVISGFLITRLIVADLRAGTWSYARFYTRRARRLFPALFVTLTASFLAALVLLLPHDLEWFASTALHSAVSTSNFLYWQELGYFGPAAERTALLHTWSLSVEEQFYLVWPALLLVVLGGGRYREGWIRTLWPVGMLVAAGALSVWAGQSLLQSDRQAVFYLMPFRIVEFAAGAVLVWIPRLPERLHWAEEALLAAGLGILAWCILTYHKDLPFPGVNALLPALGAALAIYGGRASRVGVLLRNPALVWVGLVSYSLYLVHWPLLVFSERALLRPLDGLERTALLLAALVIAGVMVRYVERPFREAPKRPRHLAPAAFGLACAGLTLALMWTSSTVLIGEGWLWRIPAEVRQPLAGLELARNDRETHNRTGVCHLNMWVGKTALGGFLDDRCLRIDPERPNYLIVGDSHGADRYSGLSALFQDVSFLQMTTASCRPLLGNPSRDYYCQERMEYAFRELIPRVPLDGVVLAGRWRPEDLELLVKTLEYLRSLGVRTVVLGPAAELNPWVTDLVFRYGRRQGLEEWVSRFLVAERFEMDARVRQISESAGAEFYSAIDAFCPGRLCQVLSPEGKLLVVDYGHQSPAGALVQAQGLKVLGLAFPRTLPPAKRTAAAAGAPAGS